LWEVQLIYSENTEFMEKKIMRILVIGGTRFFGIHMINELLAKGHNVTIATRGKVSDEYGDRVKRITIERTNETSMKNALSGRHYDVVIDKIAYCSNDIKYAMEAVDCDKYIHMSSTSVYEPKHTNTMESDFNGVSKKLVWCDRIAFPYEEIKRQAERALWQEYSDRNWIAVRYPFAIGKDDYTKRLLYYVEHTIKSIPMNIDNLDCQMGYIRSDEAGKFMAFLVDKDVRGAINGSSKGTISIREIIEYVEKKTGTKAVIDKTGEDAPYNGEPEYSINTEKAKSLGFQFSLLQDWIYELLDYYIQLVN
jgi:Nucleoside-diphosphate-sugar epimerases